MDVKKSVDELLRTWPALPAYQMLCLKDMFLQAKTEECVHHCMTALRQILPGSPPIMLAVSGHGKRHPLLNRLLNCGWSEQWVELYLAQNFKAVDPVLAGALDVPICWSRELEKIDGTASGRRFLEACSTHDMTHGLTVICESGPARVVMSLKGREAEDNDGTIKITSMIWPHVVEAVRRTMVPPNRLYELSDREREVFSRIAGGMSYTKAADELGITEATVRTHVERMISRYNVRNARHLVGAILGGED